MSTARILRLKAAQNQLIAVCGGIDAAVAMLGGGTRYARSTVGRWNALDDGTLMPLEAVLALEAESRQPLVTAALAELNGRRLACPDAATATQAGVLAHHAEAIVQAGELMAAGAAAFADGRVTPNEATAIDRAAGELEQALGEYRKALAGIRAEGGLSVVGGRDGGRG